MVLSDLRINLLANAEIRDNGTFCLVRDALKRRMGLNADNVRWLTRGYPMSIDKDPDLWIFVDDGRDDIPMEAPHPSACWLIDTHLGYDTRLAWAKQFDYVFTAQRDAVFRMTTDGIKRVYWLPLACHPPAQPSLSELLVHPARNEFAGKKGFDKQHDVVFVGYLNRGVPGDSESHDRVAFLDAMFREFPNFWFTPNCFHEEMAARYVRGRLGLNLSIKQDLNMRFFEVPSTGTAQLVNSDQEGWDALGFVDGKHFIGFSSTAEAIEKAHYYLDHPMEREEIARQGHLLVRAEHTYVHRMQRMLNVCGIM